jgi:hypothetical protein
MSRLWGDTLAKLTEQARAYESQHGHFREGPSNPATEIAFAEAQCAMLPARLCAAAHQGMCEREVLTLKPHHYQRVLFFNEFYKSFQEGGEANIEKALEQLKGAAAVYRDKIREFGLTPWLVEVKKRPVPKNGASANSLEVVLVVRWSPTTKNQAAAA